MLVVIKRMIKHEDISNQQFGKLTAISYDKGGRWNCLCQCGTTCVRSITALKTNRAYCGSIRCKIKTDIVGMRFGRLLVLDDFKLEKRSGKWNRSYVKVHCDCGKEKYVMTVGLLGGDIQSCGCYKIDMQEEKVRKPYRMSLGRDANEYLTNANKLRRHWFRSSTLKLTILTRDSYLCSICHCQNSITNKLQIHHIVPVSVDLDKWDKLENLVTLCKHCHYNIAHPAGNVHKVDKEVADALQQLVNVRESLSQQIK